MLLVPSHSCSTAEVPHHDLILYFYCTYHMAAGSWPLLLRGDNQVRLKRCLGQPRLTFLESILAHSVLYAHQICLCDQTFSLQSPKILSFIDSNI